MGDGLVYDIVICRYVCKLPSDVHVSDENTYTIMRIKRSPLPSLRDISYSRILVHLHVSHEIRKDQGTYGSFKHIDLWCSSTHE
jgi:hypothetical protein